MLLQIPLNGTYTLQNDVLCNGTLRSGKAQSAINLLQNGVSEGHSDQ